MYFFIAVVFFLFIQLKECIFDLNKTRTLRDRVLGSSSVIFSMLSLMFVLNQAKTINKNTLVSAFNEQKIHSQKAGTPSLQGGIKHATPFRRSVRRHFVFFRHRRDFIFFYSVTSSL